MVGGEKKNVAGVEVVYIKFAAAPSVTAVDDLGADSPPVTLHTAHVTVYGFQNALGGVTVRRSPRHLAAPRCLHWHMARRMPARNTRNPHGAIRQLPARDCTVGNSFS